MNSLKLHPINWKNYKSFFRLIIFIEEWLNKADSSGRNKEFFFLFFYFLDNIYIYIYMCVCVYMW